MTGSLKKAERLFREFHQYDPVSIGDFHRSFSIPKEAIHIGYAETMFYSSDKLNPTTGEDEGWIKYFHEHEGDVRLCVTDESMPGKVKKIPKWIHGVKALTLLGEFDGFEYSRPDGSVGTAEPTGRKPEWYCIPSGKALIAIQDKRRVLVVAYGGSLNVEWRGVVG